MAIKKGNIGNALHSVAPDHVVTTTDEVFDETQNKYQSEINSLIGGDISNIEGSISDIESDISDIESDISSIEANIGYYECNTGASTAAKTISASGYSLVVGGAIKVKFINTNTASSSVTLNINGVGAKPLYYNGNLVDANNKWRAGEVVNIYYDGTNYQANSVDGGSGDGVYDISAEHLTEGNPTKYATLSEALGTNGANIPTNKRKGGMSIKYIQTSDNNYVQYRYMGTETTGTPNPFLDTANWQGFDTKPIPASKNLLESGVIANSLNIICDAKVIAGTVIFTSQDVNVGDTIYYKIEVTASAGTYSFQFFDANDDVLSTYDGYRHSVGDVVDGYIVIPENFSYAKTRWQTCKAFIGGCTFGKVLDKRVKDDENNISKNASDVKSLNILTGNVQLELGSASFGTNGWTYSNSNKKARSIQNVGYKLEKGCVISISDYTNNSLYIGYRLDGNYYVSGLVQNGRFVCPMTAEYAILIIDNTDTPHDDVSYFTNLLKIEYLDDHLEDRLLATNKSVADIKYGVGYIFSSNNVPAGTDLFTSNDVADGETVYYKLTGTGTTPVNCSFSLLYGNNQKVNYYFPNTTKDDVREGYLVIPDGFVKAQTRYQPCNITFCKRKGNDNLQYLIDKNNANILEIVHTRLNSAITNGVTTDDFELGNINISTNGWSYSSSTTRVRTKEGTSLHLFPGTVIRCPKYDFVEGETGVKTFEFYVGWKTENGEYKTPGAWIGESYTITEEGDYVILLKSNISGDLTSADTLSERVTVHSLFEDVTSVTNEDSQSIVYSFTKAINHRGYNNIAPENTLPAYQLSKKYGFEWVETDVRVTQDGVYVLLHDETINRTSNGTGNVADLTYAQLLQYDFGSWKGEEWTGTKIPTLDEFLILCRNLGLKIYFDLKLGTQEYISHIINKARGYGFSNDMITYAGGYTSLEIVKSINPKARLAYIVQELTDSVITTYNLLKSDDNEVVIYCWHYNSTPEQEAAFESIKAACIPIEVWVINEDHYVKILDPYISGVLSNNSNAERVMYQKYIKIKY